MLKTKSAVTKNPSIPKREVDAAGGSMFRDILRQIRRIPCGKVAAYGDVAYAAGYPGAARQVAWALHGCGRTVPWQRVIGSGGKILCTGELGFEQRLRLQGEGVEFTACVCGSSSTDSTSSASERAARRVRSREGKRS